MSTSETAPDVIVELAQAAAGRLDEAFLSRLVDVLRRYMDVSLAFVGLGQGDPIDRVNAVYAVKNGQATKGFAYELSGAPCELVYAQSETVVLPCDLARQFPREAGFDSYIGVPLRDASGAVIGHLGVFSDRDIRDADRAAALLAVLAQRVEAELRRTALETQREQALSDLRKQTRRLQARQRTIRAQNAHKTRLLGIIAHDLRAPLAAIMSQAELAETHAQRAAEDTERLERALGKVIRNAETMSDLIDATLHRVREEDGNLALDLEPCDPGAILRLSCDEAQGEAARKSITLTLELAPAMSFLADEVLITRAVDNLVSNALKYTPPGGRVRVNARHSGDGLRIEVSDNGQGLSEDDLSRVAEPFQTLSAKPTGGEIATGLGLSNVRAIAEAHGGRLDVHSDGTGRGAVFALCLPLERPPAS